MQLGNNLRELAVESRHGLALKLAAFGARALLLVAVLPNLLVGELAQYMFTTTVALLAARILLLGLDLELPLTIRGKLQKAREFSAGVWLGWAGTLLAGILFLFQRDVVTATIVLIFSLASNQFLGGTVRTIEPESFERLINIPILLFTAGAIILGIDTAIMLLIMRGITSLLVQVVVALRMDVLRRPSLHSLKMLSTEVSKSLRSGWRKLLSNLSLRTVLRGFILWPKALQSVALSDSIAFAVAVGDVIYQLGMVFANRRYAALAKQETIDTGYLKSTVRIGILMSVILIVLGIAGINIAFLAGILPAMTTAGMLSQAVIFFAMLCLFSLMQFITWTLRTHDWIAIGTQVALFACQGLICLVLPPENWFLAAAAGAALISALLGTLALRSAEVLSGPTG